MLSKSRMTLNVALSPANSKATLQKADPCNFQFFFISLYDKSTNHEKKLKQVSL